MSKQVTLALIVARPGPLRNSLQALMTTMPQIEVLAETSDPSALLRMGAGMQPDVVLVDADLPKEQVWPALQHINEKWCQCRSIVLVGDSLQQQEAQAAGANVALINGIEPPRELFEVDRHRVIGLTLEHDRLVAYRRRRQLDLGVSAPTDCSDPKVILQDLEYSRQVFRTGRFATVDVTSKPIEESANEVVALVVRNAGRAHQEAD